MGKNFIADCDQCGYQWEVEDQDVVQCPKCDRWVNFFIPKGE